MAKRSGLLLLGLSLPLVLLSARNVVLADRWSPVPTNGGVVLHQLYNPENPRALSGAPSFVRYGHPSEIRRGYVDEAQHRLGRDLDDKQVEAYWRGEARAYLLAHPWQSLRNGLRKLGEFSAYKEVPNNRSYADERLFSPLLRLLPQPFGWLFALGVPGLVLLVWRDRRAALLLAPVAMGTFTIAVFFAEDRFRFNIVTPFVFGAALWITFVVRSVRSRRWPAVGLALLVSLVLGAFSAWQASRISPTPMDWQRITNGYIRMGERAQAKRLLAEVELAQPGVKGVHEFRGVMAVQEKDWPAARVALEAALAERQDRHEVWHNYSLVLEHYEELELALMAQAQAEALAPLPEYRFRLGTLFEALGRPDEAAELYQMLLDEPHARGDTRDWAAEASARVRLLNSP